MFLIKCDRDSKGDENFLRRSRFFFRDGSDSAPLHSPDTILQMRLASSIGLVK